MASQGLHTFELLRQCRLVVAVHQKLVPEPPHFGLSARERRFPCSVPRLEWQQQTAKGDCDANGVYNILDFVCFQEAFVQGCP